MALCASLLLAVASILATNPTTIYAKKVQKTNADGLSQTYMQYFCTVQMPGSNSLTFGAGTYDYDTGVLSFGFSYQGNDPASGTPEQSYELPVFELLVPEGEDPIEIGEVEVTGFINGSGETKSGDVVTSNPVIK